MKCKCPFLITLQEPGALLLLCHERADEVARSLHARRRVKLRSFIFWSQRKLNQGRSHCKFFPGAQASICGTTPLTSCNCDLFCFVLSPCLAGREATGSHNLLKMRILLGSRRGRLEFHKTYACASAEGSGVVSQIQSCLSPFPSSFLLLLSWEWAKVGITKGDGIAARNLRNHAIPSSANPI